MQSEGIRRVHWSSLVRLSKSLCLENLRPGPCASASLALCVYSGGPPAPRRSPEPDRQTADPMKRKGRETPRIVDCAVNSSPAERPRSPTAAGRDPGSESSVRATRPHQSRDAGGGSCGATGSGIDRRTTPKALANSMARTPAGKLPKVAGPKVCSVRNKNLRPPGRSRCPKH